MSGPVDVLAVLSEIESFMAISYPHYDSAEKLRAARTAVAGLIEALAAIRDFRGELNAPVANSVKLRGIARAALANIGNAS